MGADLSRREIRSLLKCICDMIQKMNPQNEKTEGGICKCWNRESKDVWREL